jgi:hypothetical protein
LGNVCHRRPLSARFGKPNGWSTILDSTRLQRPAVRDAVANAGFIARWSQILDRLATQLGFMA